jgi:hypothetical protein
MLLRSIATVLVAIPVFMMTAAAQSPADAPGCGVTKAEFDITTQKKAPPKPVPDPTKAVIYFLQDDLSFASRPRPTTLFGVDGNWVGATHSNSYFFLTVDPGEHHLCSDWEKNVVLGVSDRPREAALHFTAEGGMTYFFRAKDVFWQGGPFAVKLEQMDSDEAQVIMKSFEFSASRLKK